MPRAADPTGGSVAEHRRILRWPRSTPSGDDDGWRTASLPLRLTRCCSSAGAAVDDDVPPAADDATLAVDAFPPAAAATPAGGASEVGVRGPPTHLVVTVNGIVGRANDWKFAAKSFNKYYSEDVFVHCSKNNGAARTLRGVDKMGKILAAEVASVVSQRHELEKISFLAHSLGGLVARYAIALLFDQGKIAGLKPINFITFATPHLGSRFHKQIPIFRGVHRLEKVAYRMSWIAGRSGKHLFLKDNEDGKPPLLLQMATDYDDDHLFISALKSFERRVVYSNIAHDFVVGWKTSSIRRQHELPKRDSFVNNERYKHIVHVEKSMNLEEGYEAERIDYVTQNMNEMEEVMIRGLNRVPWERVDVSFADSRQKIFAHSTIQVKNRFFHSDGCHVIYHMIENFVY